MNGRVAPLSLSDDARRAKVRRNAWLLGGVVVLFYLGIITWYVVRAQSGG
jgi:hypothetical protein